VRLTFYIFTLSKGIDDAQGIVFPWLRFVDQITFSHSIFFSIMCTSVTGGIMINRRQLYWYSIRETTSTRTSRMHLKSLCSRAIKHSLH